MILLFLRKVGIQREMSSALMVVSTSGNFNLFTIRKRDGKPIQDVHLKILSGLKMTMNTVLCRRERVLVLQWIAR